MQAGRVGEFVGAVKKGLNLVYSSFGSLAQFLIKMTHSL
jgi:hypothetical protein